MPSIMSRFSQDTLDFIAKAARQTKSEWLDRHREEYESDLLNPVRDCVREASRLLKESAGAELSRYRFPDRGLARIRRTASRAEAQGWYKDWIGVQVARDSGSLYEELPSLYFHIAPGEENVFSAGGLYLPSSQQTKRIRNWIAKDPSRLEELLSDQDFRKVYKSLGDERKVKTFPRGFPKDHPKIEWLKLTGFYVWRPFSKRVFFSKEFPAVLAADWRQVLRLNSVLDHWISSDPDPTEEVASVEKGAEKNAEKNTGAPEKKSRVRQPDSWDW